MELSEYQNRKSEKERIADLISLLPSGLNFVLDVGARDGFISKRLAEHCYSVTALDLEKPVIDHEKVHCVKGDATALEFPDATFDLVFCAEVLEHIPARLLERACNQLARVSKKYVLIGVPFKQDIRVGRTTCYTCGKQNPPWGHINSFDERRLARLFPMLEFIKTSFVGVSYERTNFVSCWLMDMGGNPYGTYSQEEPCVHCGARLKKPPERNLWRKGLTKVGFYVNNSYRHFVRRHPNWLHVLIEKKVVKQ